MADQVAEYQGEVLEGGYRTKTYSLDDPTIDRISELVGIYSRRWGRYVSQAAVLRIAVKNELDRVTEESEAEDEGARAVMDE